MTLQPSTPPSQQELVAGKDVYVNTSGDKASVCPHCSWKYDSVVNMY